MARLGSLGSDFGLLWTGSLISELGSAVTTVALPLVAVSLLHASTEQVGWLAAAGTLPFLVLALPAGVVVDRSRKHRLMLGADFGRAVIVGVVPLAAACSLLDLWELYAVAALAGTLSLVFNVSYQSFVPTVLRPQQRLRGNARLGLPSSIANVVGPSLAGMLVSAFSAPAAVLADAISFLASGATLAFIRNREDRRAPRGLTAATMLREIRAGLGFIVGSPGLRRIVACTATSNLFVAMRSSLTVVYLVRTLGADASTVGLVLSVASLGGLTGAFVCGPLSRAVGSARMLWASKAALGWMAIAIPLAQPGTGIFLVSLGSFASSMSAVIYNVNQLSYRQAISPPEMRGRINAGVRWVIAGVLPIGGLLGGYLGTKIGIRETMFVAVLGAWLSFLWVYLSPLRREREIPDHPLDATLAPTIGGSS